jgi:serine/threonine protein kinase
MIEKLASEPHEHITPHFAMWTQSGVSYILFPLAKYNLREFMSSTHCPKLTAPFVLWFLSQLSGLAGAVKHFHSLGQRISADDPATRASGGQILLGADLTDETQNRPVLAGFHHDIKSENILVFEKETSQPGNGGIFKISDFGAGRFAGLRPGQPSVGVSAAKGTFTYMAPDKHPSRPYDLWGLGCVFIELLIWALTPEQDGGRGFSNRRGWISDGTPKKDDDCFWYEDPKSGKIKLRPAVEMQLDDLMNKYSIGMNAFKKVIKLNRDLFTIETIVPPVRPTAPQVALRLAAIYDEARKELDKDPDCYLRGRRSGSLSASNAPAMEGRQPESARPYTSTTIVGESSRTRRPVQNSYVGEGSERPFLLREEEHIPTDMPHSSEIVREASAPGPASNGAATGAEAVEDIELEGANPRPHSDTVSPYPLQPSP